MKTYVNSVKLHGVITDLCGVVTTRNGAEYQKFMLTVKRLSETEDILPIVISMRGIPDCIRIGAEVTVVGTIVVDIDNPFAEKTHLLLSVNAHEVAEESAEDCNEVEIEGPICKLPILRDTPLGRTVCDTMLMASAGSNNPIPCILWGNVAREMSELGLYSHLNVVGRLQSRVYTKETEEGSETRVFYEVSAFTAKCTKRRE